MCAPKPPASRLVVIASFVAALMLLSVPAAAEPVRAVVTADLNQRAGPATRFPVLTTVPEGDPVTIFGCLSDHSWCDGAYRDTRGWFSARYLLIPYSNTNLTVSSYVRYAYLPTVSFNINSYWDRYYRERPFYARLSFYAEGGSVAVSVGSFYRPLSRHGRWTEVRGRYVWVPQVDSDWRPYTEGRWVYTRRHGWTWVSHEPFGWATDHYGRWAYSRRLGWVWVPGTRWAPAWVAWRRSDDYVAWAPLPPDPDDRFGLSIDISFGDVPNYYWRPVRWRDFGSEDASTVIIGDNNQVINIINQTEAAGTVEIENNVVVNNFVDVDYVEQQTGEEVVVRELALTASEAEDGEITDETVELYHPPESELEPADAPDEIVPEEQVAQESTTAGQSGDEPGTEELLPPAPSPDEAPPESAAATETPPLLGEGEEPEPTAPEGAPAAEEGPAPEGVEPCPENTIRQQDGSCAAPAAEPPPAEEVTPETPAETPELPPQAEPGQSQEQPAPPAGDVQPTAPEAPAAPEPCPEGTVRQQDGSCAAPAAEPPPAEEVTPETPAEMPELPPEAQPGQPPDQPAPPAGAVQPAGPDTPADPEPCPEGTVRQADGSCAAPATQPPPAEQVTPAPQGAPQVPEPQVEQQPQAPEPPPEIQAPAEPQQQQPQQAEPPPQAPQPPPEVQAPAEPQQPPPQAEPQPQAPEPPPAEAPRAEPPGPPQAPQCPEGQTPNPQGDCVPR